MKTLLISLFIPYLALALEVYTDIYELGKEPRRIILTVDPKLDAHHFQDYIFRSQELDPQEYEFLHDGKKMHPDDAIGCYRAFSPASLNLKVVKRDGKNHQMK
jgi:hypothetical protein